MCFQGLVWSRMEAVLKSCAKMIRGWAILSTREEALVLEQWVKDMEERCTRPPRLMWSGHPSSEDADGDSESVPRESVFRELSSSVLMHDDLHMNVNL
jgi:hypothetical protein